MEEETVIVCRLVKYGPPLASACSQGECCECGEKVWISASGRSQAGGQPFKMICEPCVGKVPQAKISLPGVEVIREVAAKLGLPEAEAKKRLEKLVSEINAARTAEMN